MRSRLGPTLAIAFAIHWPAVMGAQQLNRYVRYAHVGGTHYGVVEGDVVRQLAGEPFADPQETGVTLPLASIRLLSPCEPSKVIAVGLNYRSHLGDREAPTYPGLFAKMPTSIIGPDDEIVLPPDAENVHYEGELVVVIGRRAKNVSPGEAPDYILGVTAGNDVSERGWQSADLQWLRAKGSDTFGPCGPMIVSGLDYGDLLLETRLNGELRQSQRSSDLLYDVDEIVSYVSRYVTLLPGDVIFTGTPGTTGPMQDGDIVEVELEGVGILRNTIVRASSP